MTRPRSTMVSLEATPYYHCISRCVRRAFLCGDDHYSQKNFDHRKPWFIQRLKLLGEAFSIDIAAYAIMSNHYHLVLHVDSLRSLSWSQDEVIHQWLKLYKGPVLIHRYLNNQLHSEAEIQMVQQQVAIWRERLTSISWFMGCLNEYVARKANREDNCKGRFWESRFKSQALLDETALLSCMAYVDLNPIRAKIHPDVASSLFTSVRERIKAIKGIKDTAIPRLMPFSESSNQKQRFSAIPFRLKDYIELVDWAGRCIRQDKRGNIDKHEPALLSTIGLSEDQWKILSLEIQKESISMLHGLNKLASIEKKLSRQTTV